MNRRTVLKIPENDNIINTLMDNLSLNLH